MKNLIASDTYKIVHVSVTFLINVFQLNSKSNISSNKPNMVAEPDNLFGSHRCELL